MDSRVVSREIRREIWPALREAGFQCCTSRNAWKLTAARIWVVSFQSFNSYFSSVDGCTTFSFVINLGIYIPSLRSEPEPTLTKPKHHQCHLRRTLSKRLAQPACSRKDIWYVEPLGDNLLEVLADARSTILEEGVSWFRSFDSDDTVLRVLLENDEIDELFGIGARSSAHRKVLSGRLAVAIGQMDLGVRLLKEADEDIQSARQRFGTLFKPSERC